MLGKETALIDMGTDCSNSGRRGVECDPGWFRSVGSSGRTLSMDKVRLSPLPRPPRFWRAWRWHLPYQATPRVFDLALD